MGVKSLIVVISMLFTLSVNAEPYYNQPTGNTQVLNDFAEYMQNVNEKLQKNWTPPDFLEEAHTRILFKLNRDGEIYAANIIESSGDKIYDEAAINALKKAMPFGTFPENSTRQTLAVNYSFDTSLVKTDRMKSYYNLSKQYFITDKQNALKYADLAIKEVNNDDESYFLYKHRGKIKEALGDHVGANQDFTAYNSMKKRIDIKRVHALKYQAEIEDTAFAYFYLAYAYEMIQDYENAIHAINKAIERTELNNNYKRYRTELVKKISL